MAVCSSLTILAWSSVSFLSSGERDSDHRAVRRINHKGKLEVYGDDKYHKLQWVPENMCLETPLFVHFPHRVCGSPPFSPDSDESAGAKWLAQEEARVETLAKATGVPKDIAFVLVLKKGIWDSARCEYTSSESSHVPLLQSLYDKLGIPYYTSGETWNGGGHWGTWNWYGKVTPIKQMIQDGTISEPYILYADATDVSLAFTDFAELKNKFLSYNASVLLGSRPDSDAPWLPKQIRKFTLDVYPWAEKHNTPQAGTYMAKTEALEKYFREMEQERGAISPLDLEFDDQAAWNILHARQYPDIKVDTQTKLFSRAQELNKENPLCDPRVQGSI